MSPPGHWTRSRQTRTVLIRQFLRVSHDDEVFCAFCHRTHVLPSLAADITGPGSSDMSLVTVTSSGLPYSSPFKRESEDEKHSTSCDPFVSLPTSATSAAPSPPSTSCSPSPASPSLGVRQTVATEAGPEGARESDPSLESAVFVVPFSVGRPAGPVYPHLRMTLPSTTFCPSDHMQFASAELGVSSGSPFRNIGTPPCPLVTQEPEMMDWRGGTTGTTATVKVRTLSHSIWAPRLETLKALAAREDRKHTGQ